MRGDWRSEKRVLLSVEMCGGGANLLTAKNAENAERTSFPSRFFGFSAFFAVIILGRGVSRAGLGSIHFVQLRHEFQAPPGPVAQIFNLLYRRLVVGRAREVVARAETSNAPQIANLRYSRVQLCATLVAGLPHSGISGLKGSP